MASTDPVFEAVTDGEALLRWAEKIRGDSLRSASIHNSLLVHGKGYTEKYNFYVLKEKPETNVILFKDKTNQTTIAFYCPEAHEDVVLEALSRTQLISWDEMLCFIYVPDTLVDKLRKLVQAKIGDGELDSSQADLYCYDPAEDSRDLVCPSGFSVKRLSTEATRQMNDAWKYRDCFKTNQFLEFSNKSPCAAVYRSPAEDADRVLDIAANGLPDAEDPEEKAVAWATSTMYGPLGLLGVDESLKKNDNLEDELLKKRLEQLVVTSCARAMLREGFLVNCYQEEDEREIQYMPGWNKVSSCTWLWRCDKMPQESVQEEDLGSTTTT